MKLNFKQRLRFRRKKLSLTWKFKWAHHPLCERFEDHLWHIGDFTFCQGCFLSYAGTVVGFIAFLTYFSRYIFNALGVLAVVAVSLVPVLIVEFFNFENRSLKRFIRFWGGLGLGATFSLALYRELSTWLRIISLIVAILGYGAFFVVRKHGEVEDKCEGCPELIRDGVCSGYRKEKAAIEKYNSFLEKELRDRVEREVSEKFSIGKKTQSHEPPSSSVPPAISKKLQAMIDVQSENISHSHNSSPNTGNLEKEESNQTEKRTQEAINQFLKNREKNKE